MQSCDVCGNDEFYEDIVNEVFLIEGAFVLVEHIPTTICRRCGEAIFSRETTETIRRMVNGERQPTKSVQLEVFEYAG